MQEPLAYKRWETLPAMASASPETTASGGGERAVVVAMERLVKENPVIVFGKRGCCMCHVVRKLLLGLGVNPPVFEIDGDDVNVNNVNNVNNGVNEGILVNSYKLVQFPVVFVGGELFGGLEKVMATHLSGDLVPILKQAGALWL